MSDIFSLPVLVGILTSATRLATPYLYAGIGEMFAQRSGVVNLGVDGIMLVGAFGGFYVTLQTGSVWLGLMVRLYQWGKPRFFANQPIAKETGKDRPT